MVQHPDIMERKPLPNQVLHVKNGCPMFLINRNIGRKMPQQRMITIIAGTFSGGTRFDFDRINSGIGH